MNETNRTSRYLMTIVNDVNASTTIQMLKDQYGRLKLRGRHSNRKQILGNAWNVGKINDVPIDKAEKIAIYKCKD